MLQPRGASEKRLVDGSFETNLLTRYAIVFLVKARRRRLLRWLCKPCRGLPPRLNIFVKIQGCAGLSKAYALRFVAKNTSIPIPEVYHAFVNKDKSYIVMEQIEGEMAAADWLQRSEESRSKIREQFRHMLAELRTVPCPEGTKIGALDGGPFGDCRLPSRNLWEPYHTVRGFHAALVEGFDLNVVSTDLREGLPEPL
ncbi:Protein kinase-like domain protein [Emericellopsis cladophorae]|uniref:Protein kinase-like domain protein n=1 Tax=Emericellopsis cladophorae TaxID=2686198 RepID=A0A9P9XUW6_9HYPO|nr:Protein kinase-like domain protein [Emericellopsis cladophorae]KAI6778256.1 Protein kinase-like domain protein [Emericellopsis cladophorae]